jgi:hypothetical protein
LTKQEALHIFTTAIVREILREGDEAPGIVPPGPPSPDEQPPTPRFDFDDSADTCEHNGYIIPRASCPVHGPGGAEEVTAEELDDLESEEPPGPIQRAARIAALKRQQEAEERQYAEDIPMSGMAPPRDIPPNLVV